MNVDRSAPVSALSFALTMVSRNVKTGAIPVSITSAASCPPSCVFMGSGCYAEAGPLALHWRAVTNGERGMGWADFVKAIRRLPRGTFWRHNQAGDLPGIGEALDSVALAELTRANAGRKGFTYTHKPMTEDNARAVRAANDGGFTINLSANTLAHADELARTGAGPVVVVLDATEGDNVTTTTPEGRKVRTCPATYKDSVNCARCQWCAKADRSEIIAFPAHGARKNVARTVAATGKRGPAPVKITRKPAAALI